LIVCSPTTTSGWNNLQESEAVKLAAWNNRCYTDGNLSREMASQTQLVCGL